MLVSPDSAEAFEEMIWMAGWPEHYRKDRILTWTGPVDAEFIRRFNNHLKQIIRLRQRRPEVATRYVSKNNANIARLAVLGTCCPDALIVVPVREPVQQVASLRQQHLRFLEIHAGNRFTRDYMRGIGHFEFGDNRRPIDFDGWLATARYDNPAELDFWLEYWIAAYEHILHRHAGRVRFLAYDAFCASPARGLRLLASLVDAADPQALMAQQGDVHPPRPHRIDTGSLDRTLVSRADAVYRELVDRAQVAA